MHIPTPDELRARRVRLGIRQMELAERAGISQSMVARIEAGSVDPRTSTLKKIVRVLNTADQPRLTASHVMHTPVFSVHASEPVTRALEIMNLNNISQIPVIEDGVPVGCISESAIVSVIEEQSAHRAVGLAVKNFMEPGFPTVPPGMDVDTVVRILQNNHAVLVMDAGTVKGVITKHDLISMIVDRAP